ncbi:MAG TPA: transporter substrate-binding domain-containing protein [Vicinamibacteria bacterium]|nr:transporter substrate-binding domain-containing protein [Vicinamibacteria bacterium]
MDKRARRILTLGLGLCAAGSALAAPADLDEVTRKGALRVLSVLVNQQEAFISAKPGIGLDRELLEGFAALHRIPLTVVPVGGWDELVPALLEGRGDVIAGRFTVTEARRRQIDFTVEVFPTRSVVLTRRPHRVVATLEELHKERVGTVKGTSMADALAAARVPPANVDDGILTGTLPAALKAGRVTAIVLGVENAIADRREDPDLQLGVFLGPPGSLAWGVRKTDPKLRQALDAYIGGVRRTPTWSRLVVKYFGEEAPEILKKARAENMP